MIDREEPKLSPVRQCALLGIRRSSLYYLPTEAGAEDLELLARIDQPYLKTPFYGSGRMTAWLRNHGHQVNRKRVRRLMQLLGVCLRKNVLNDNRLQQSLIFRFWPHWSLSIEKEISK